MNHRLPLHSLALLCVPLMLAAGASAQTAAALTAPAQRISDESVQHDLEAFEAMEHRIEALDTGGRRLADYPLAKAQCWLDVAFHEYSRNDRSDFPAAAYGEAGKLVTAMEQGAAPPADETPLVNDAARLRPDLWNALAELKRGSGYRCAQRKIACAEVELVHAGNEYRQQQWRHANPYVQIAEDLVGEAAGLPAQCTAAAAALPASAQVAVVAPPAPAAHPVRPAATTAFVGVVLFNFDGDRASDIEAGGQALIETLASQIRQPGVTLKSIRLTGHADRLNGTGDADYNLQLSRRRVQTVQDLLVAQGIDRTLVQGEGRGDREPLSACPDSARDPLRLRNCLVNDRRVRIEITTERALAP